MNSSPASAASAAAVSNAASFGQAERAAGVAARRERLVQRQQRGRGAAQRLQEGAPAVPTRRACSPIRSAASALARATTRSAAPVGTRRWRSDRS